MTNAALNAQLPASPQAPSASASAVASTVASHAASPTLGTDAVPRVAAGFRLQWEPVQDCHVLLYPEGMVKLNRSAGEILVRCDGVRDVSAIVAELETAFGATDLLPDVLAFLAMARKNRWLAVSAGSAVPAVPATPETAP